MYKTLGPWRTPKWVWPYRIERQPVGPRKRPCSRYIGNWDVTDVTGTLLAAMLVRGHNGIPLKRGHLLGS